jgi:hypothetical protein
MTGHFEAKKHAYRQTQDGVVISFVIHPDEVDSALATASLGTRYMIGFAEIGEDGKPVKAPAPVAVKEAKPFASLPLSQQAAIRCQDNDFKLFMGASNADDAASMVRERCGAKSRSDIAEGTPAGTEWMFLNAEYQAWLTTQRYGSLAR